MERNVLRSEKGYLDRYLKVGIRVPALDAFEVDAQNYREI